MFNDSLKNNFIFHIKYIYKGMNWLNLKLTVS